MELKDSHGNLFIVLLDRHCTSLMRNFILFQGNRPCRPFPITENIMKKRECSKMKYRLVLLADGCERQNALVRYYQTCRNSYTDMLYPSLRMVCCAAIAGFALSRAIEHRCSGLIKIAYILPHHCPIDRTVGEG